MSQVLVTAGFCQGEKPVMRVSQTYCTERIRSRFLTTLLTSDFDLDYFLSAGWFTPSEVGISFIFKGFIPSRHATLTPHSVGFNLR